MSVASSMYESFSNNYTIAMIPQRSVCSALTTLDLIGVCENINFVVNQNNLL